MIKKDSAGKPEALHSVLRHSREEAETYGSVRGRSRKRRKAVGRKQEANGE